MENVTADDVEDFLLREMAVEEWLAEVLMEDIKGLKQQQNATFQDLLRVRALFLP